MSSKLHNLNSKLHKFINKNKTFKNYYKRKIQFVNNIITNWKKIVHGNIHIDNKTIYKYDFYLSFTGKNDYYNHIHLALHKGEINYKNNNTIIYIMKTINKNKIIHSKPYTISIFSNPKTVVLNMINNYIKFI